MISITASYENLGRAGVEAITAKTIRFPGGEVQIRLDLEGRAFPYGSTFYIKADLCNSQNVMELLMATDALRRAEPDAAIKLVMPYIPYARQDRVAVPGEALSIKVFADLINAQMYDSVTVWDAHSDVSVALLDRVVHITAAQIISSRGLGLGLFEDCVIVAPDAGAVRRAGAVAKMIGTELVRADKSRDPRTGEITGTSILTPGGYKYAPFVIVDDICDGGRTFIELAKALRAVSQRPIHLYVTHGIFSAGFDQLKRHLATIICANVISTEEPPPGFLIKI